MQPTQLFYQGEKLAGALQGQHFQRTLHASLPLAQHRAGEPAQLLATETAGSVMRVVAPAHDAVNVFSAYGHAAARAQPVAYPMFNGERLDETFGGYLLGNGHRGYRPDLMRFVSPDRLSPFGAGGTNAYAYCGGEPVNHSDPSGKSSFSIIKSRAEVARIKVARKLSSSNRATNTGDQVDAPLVRSDYYKIESYEKETRALTSLNGALEEEHIRIMRKPNHLTDKNLRKLKNLRDEKKHNTERIESIAEKIKNLEPKKIQRTHNRPKNNIHQDLKPEENRITPMRLR
ncbi:RHS repeat-associated core domain-containing protein [Pseudomonas sp. NPDC089554]|uniref:RHS repeat-associated core domain-containing protein n=1 Tax=Pseudomonas sp. NPDC089554 TaxID=3390653 RepID=UPI003CFD89C1